MSAFGSGDMARGSGHIPTCEDMYSTLYLPKRGLRIFTLTVRNTVIFSSLLVGAYFIWQLWGNQIREVVKNQGVIYASSASKTSSTNSGAPTSREPSSSAPSSTFNQLLKK